MKKLRLNFTNMWENYSYRFNPMNNYFINMFRLDFDVELDARRPDLVVFSCYGNEADRTNHKLSRKIFYQGEVSGPLYRVWDPSEYDLMLGLPIDASSDKVVYFPHWIIYVDWFNQGFLPLPNSPRYLVKLEDLEARPDATSRRKQICQALNNASNPDRALLLERLEGLFEIVNYGSLRNNSGGKLGMSELEKVVEFSKYDFSLATENCQRAGYVSEKLLHSLAANTIPIYWGDKSFKNFFNEEKIIDLGATEVEFKRAITLLRDALQDDFFIERRKLISGWSKACDLSKWSPRHFLNQIREGLSI